MKIRTIAIAAATWAALIGAPAHAQTRVYVFTAADASGFTDKDTELRVGAVKEIKTRLQKDPRVHVVDRSEDGEVSIEVTFIGVEQSSSSTSRTTRGIFGGVQTDTSKDWVYHERATLHAGSYSTDLETGAKTFGILNHHGETMANAIRDWVKRNAGTLAAKGGSK